MDCLDIQNVTQATENEIKFSCPFPGHSGGDETPSAYMNVHTTAFFCHSCHEKGNAIHFTCKVLRISPLKAIEMLKARYSAAGINPEAVNMVAEVEKILTREPDKEAPMPILDPAIVDRFAVDWLRVAESPPELRPPAMEYIMFERDFDAETLIDWEFGYDQQSDRIVFPVYNHQGTLVGFKGRAHDRDRKPKYLILGDRPGRPERYGWPCYHNSKIVFGLHRLTHVKGPKDLIMCEGELDVVALSQHGFDFAVSANGSLFSQTQARLIRDYADSVTLFFDTDPAGNDGTQMVIDALRDFMPVRIVPPHEGDPASMSYEEIERCLDEAVPCTLRDLLVR